MRLDSAAEHRVLRCLWACMLALIFLASLTGLAVGLSRYSLLPVKLSRVLLLHEDRILPFVPCIVFVGCFIALIIDSIAPRKTNKEMEEEGH